mmetsp:Transcript_24393/g.22166  ORF Transcript_24393/g.22166 Transcript_24393/m.22166 type:complete len:236 (-) Transcript_24393:108-815(-)
MKSITFQNGKIYENTSNGVDYNIDYNIENKFIHRINKRSGKWTREEIKFANRLISDFEAGILKDCEDGCTLRSYLARRLNCSPMRISKKFSGQKIGKLVFSRNIDAVVISGRTSLEQLEYLFHKSSENRANKIELNNALDYQDIKNNLSNKKPNLNDQSTLIDSSNPSLIQQSKLFHSNSMLDFFNNEFPYTFELSNNFYKLNSNFSELSEAEDWSMVISDLSFDNSLMDNDLLF